MEKWIKLSMSIFENRKIKRIMAEKDGAELFIVWIKLLCLAGELADVGRVYLPGCCGYDVTDLAIAIDVPRETLCRAIDIFGRLSMVVEDADGVPRIKNFADFQSIDVLERMRRAAMLKKKAEDEERLREIDGIIEELTSEEQTADKMTPDNKEIKKHTKHVEIREKEGEREKKETAASLAESNERPLSQYGRYDNVLLSDVFYDEVSLKHGDLARGIIDELSAYIASKNVNYSNHEAVVDLWIARRIEKEKGRTHKEAPREKEKPRYGNFDPDAAFKAALARSFPDDEDGDTATHL